MSRRSRLLVVALMIVPLTACAKSGGGGSGTAASPATVDHIAATGQVEIHLTTAAARRLGIQTATVQMMAVPAPGSAAPALGGGGGGGATFTAFRRDTPDVPGGVPPAGSGAPALVPVTPATTAPPPPPALRLVAPYSSLLYEPNGDAFTYANNAPLAYVHQPLTVDYITGDWAVLVAGPPPGTRVVTVGASELLGIEQGVGE
jgi:hypothetical protein